MYRLGFGTTAVSLMLVLHGCDDTRSMSGVDAGERQDAQIVSPDASSPDASSPDPDAGTPPTTRNPDVPIKNGGDPSWDVMSFVALNIVADEVGRITRVFAVVRNDDPSLTLCSLSPDLHLIDGSGTDLGFIGLVVTGAPMVTSLVASCVPPGGIGLAYGNTSGALDLSTIARLEVTWWGSGSTTAVPYADVANEGQAVIDPYGGGSYFALEGTLRVVSGTVHNPGVFVFPMVDGLPMDQLIERQLGDFGAGSTLPYTTTATQTPFTEYLVALDYRDPSPIYGDGPELREALGARDRFDSIREANERRDLVRLAQ